ncbi:MAG: alanyl-tRNA editing protein [Hyphomicrobiales bacterium]|nr:alanyl-tRNA editing protein [Hyphomicrobiales bacterium]
MNSPTHPDFLDDAYQRSCNAEILSVNELGGIILDRTVFYANSGGQPGDSGWIELADGSKIEITTTVKDKASGGIALVPSPQTDENIRALAVCGQKIDCHIHWARRYNLMKMHTACHLLSIVCPYPVTSANVGENESRVDFDMPELPATKQEISAAMMQLVEADYPIFDQWIDQSELDANPDLVRSKNVKPPRGAGRIRLVCIGEDSSIDSQPCGGTHVKTTAEVGAIHIGKIEKKGKENRRFRIRFGDIPNA